MNTKLENALSLIESCLIGYCETNIESDIEAQLEVNQAWRLIYNQCEKATNQ